jgi:hypothetical protein
LLVGGQWDESFYAASRYIQGYRQGAWVRIASTTTSLPGSAALGGVRKLIMFDSGSGPELYAGGSFAGLSPGPGCGVAKWTGTGWVAVGDISYGVHDLVAYDDGAGTKLYACGEFIFGPFMTPIVGIARWNGAAWESPGASTVTRAFALAVFDEDGPGPGRPALFLGGNFSAVGGVPARAVARWDGQVWTEVGGGIWVSQGGLYAGTVRTLAVHNDGSGPALYAGGQFDHASNAACINIAKWAGTAWAAVGEGVYINYSPGLQVLRSFDDGSGPTLYAGGSLLESTYPFYSTNIRRWRAGHWETVAGGLTGGTAGVRALEVFDDGGGSALIAGGDFSSTLRKLTPAGWVDVFPVLQSTNVYDGGVHELKQVDLGHGPVLLAGGGLVGIDLPTGIYSDNIVELRGCPCYANCDRSSAAPILNVADFICFMNRYSTGDPWANCDGSTAQPVLNVADFICFGNKFAAGCP